MNDEKIFEIFDKIKQNKNSDERSPHKPLLILLALARLSNKNYDSISFLEVEKDLNELLKEFGKSSTKPNSHYPFWRLQNDNIWVINGKENIDVSSFGDVKITDLRLINPAGSFEPEIREYLIKNPKIIYELAKKILDSNFPETIHSDILSEIGFNFQNIFSNKKRQSNFRSDVLNAYGHKCAVCGMKIHLDNLIICLEAAHIKWHSAGGPDETINGISLCPLHHKFFDYGLFTLDENKKIKVSDIAHGNKMFDYYLKGYSKKQIHLPDSSNYFPDEKYINWHSKEVFKTKRF
jgi:putative restriction endonuclease